MGIHAVDGYTVKAIFQESVHRIDLVEPGSHTKRYHAIHRGMSRIKSVQGDLRVLKHDSERV